MAATSASQSFILRNPGLIASVFYSTKLVDPESDDPARDFDRRISCSDPVVSCVEANCADNT